MFRNKLLAALMCTLVLACTVSFAYAQNGGGRTDPTQRMIQQVLAVVGPRTSATCGNPNTRPECNALWDWVFIYPLFFLAIITMGQQSDKQLLTTLIMAAVLMLIVLAKLGPGRVIDASLDPDILAFPRGLLWFVFNAGVFVFPLIVAGMTKAKKSVPFAIIGGVWGGVYFFAFWFIAQRCAGPEC